MEEIMKQELTIKQMTEINTCRIHLQVSCISDIHHTSGNKLDPEALQGYNH